MRPDSSNPDPARYTLIPASRFLIQTWLFRAGMIATCFVSMALLNWLVRESAAPLLEALLPAIGLLLGFAAMQLLDSSRRKYPR